MESRGFKALNRFSSRKSTLVGDGGFRKGDFGNPPSWGDRPGSAGEKNGGEKKRAAESHTSRGGDINGEVLGKSFQRSPIRAWKVCRRRMESGGGRPGKWLQNRFRKKVADGVRYGRRKGLAERNAVMMVRRSRQRKRKGTVKGSWGSLLLSH